MPRQKHSRLAVIDRELCNPRNCGWYLCQRVCPVNRAKKDCITVFEEGEKADKKPLIDEVLCIGCGICVHKCPTQAISVVNLPEKLDENPVHRYGRNGFSLYSLPMPKKGMVTALVGPNGVGKSTLMNVLSGNLVPNSGLIDKQENEIPWQLIKERFKGTEVQDYLEMLSGGRVRASYKPQHVDLIPRMYKGRVRETLAGMADKMGTSDGLDGIVKRLGLEEMLDKRISDLSGGELQLFAIAGAFLKHADFYFFDEPSSYLDVHERLKVAREIRSLTGKAVVMVVEHDLAVADYLADNVHILYGNPSVFGIVSVPYGVRMGINAFLEGYLKEENMRFRQEPIIFGKGAKETAKSKLFAEYPAFEKSFGRSFFMSTEPGQLYKGEVVGILGPNAIGKTTFIRMLTGEIKPDSVQDGLMKSDKAVKPAARLCYTGMEGLSLSYKPQRLVLDKKQETLMVRDFIKAVSGKKVLGKEERRIIRLLKLERLLERTMKRLSGGEMQSAFIAAALIKDCDLLLMDEPSAFLDVDQRLMAARLIRERAEGRDMPCFVVDHDLQFIDAISDRVMVFSGKQGVKGHGNAPSGLREGMNAFLKSLDITFRRDPGTGRARANKPGSQKDGEQKQRGQYYYMG